MDEPPAKKLRPSPPASTPPSHVLLQHWRGEQHKMSSKQLSFYLEALLAHVGVHAGQTSQHGLFLGGHVLSEKKRMRIFRAYSRFKIHVGQNLMALRACGKILASKDSYLEVVLGWPNLSPWPFLGGQELSEKIK